MPGESGADPAGAQGLEPPAGPGPEHGRQDKLLTRTCSGRHSGSIVFGCNRCISLMKWKNKMFDWTVLVYYHHCYVL